FLPDVAGGKTLVTFHDLRIPFLFPKAGGLRPAAVTHLARAAAGVIVTDPADELELRRRGGVAHMAQIPIGSNIMPDPPPGYDRADHILRTGFVEAAQVSAHLLACDAVVLPYRDGVSFRRGSLMAALAHGCTIITTEPQTTMPELRDGENVRLVPADSAQALV